MLIYIILADNSRRWSLDAKRRARGSTRLTNTETQVGTVFLNLSLCLIVAQLCIVYFEAGMYKVQGRQWQEGMAMYYPISSKAYGVFPWLSEILTTNTWMVVLLTYFTVIVQIAFPFLLFNRITRRIALISILGVHIAIAMGLSFFSGIMASADAVLVAAATWITIGTWLGNQFRSIGRRFPKFKERIRDEDEPQKSVVPRDPEPIVGKDSFDKKPTLVRVRGPCEYLTVPRHPGGGTVDNPLFLAADPTACQICSWAQEIDERCSGPPNLGTPDIFGWALDQIAQCDELQGQLDDTQDNDSPARNNRNFVPAFLLSHVSPQSGVRVQRLQIVFPVTTTHRSRGANGNCREAVPSHADPSSSVDPRPCPLPGPGG